LTGYSLTASPSTVTEGNQVTFTITRSGDKPVETVYFSTLSDGTATYAEGDYTTTSGGQPLNIAVSFSSGTTSRTVTLNIINDGVSDSGEQFRAIVQRNASDPVSTYLDRSSFVTINDPAASTSYSLTPSPTTVIEGNQVTFTITRSGDKPAETVYFSTLSDGTATYGEGDYTTTSGGQPANIAVSFSSGTTSRTVTLNIISDGVSDSGEQFRAIVQRSSSDPVSTYLDRSSYVTINDASASTTYSLTPSVTTITEGNQVTFTITRSGDKPAETVYFSTLSDGTATYAEGDYTTTSGGQPANVAVPFSSGSTSQTVTLNIINDGVSDSGEQFRAIVQRSSSDPVSTYLDRSAFVTINDASASTTYSLTASPTTVIEGNQVTFTITRSGDKPAETVYFSTLADGTATYAGGDYTTTSGGQPANIAVTFGSGITSQTVALNIVNDGVADAGEQFRAIVQRNSSDPVSTYLYRSDFVTINEGVAQNTTYSLTPSTTSVTEGAQVTFTVTRVGDKPGETVYFSTLSSGTATYAEGDYTTSSGGKPENVAVTFLTGEAARTVTLNIREDNTNDTGEQFRAIVQRLSSDSVSTYLDRSPYVTISDVSHVAPGNTPIDEDQYNSFFGTPVAHAGSLSFRYPVGGVGRITEQDDSVDDYRQGNDLGVQYSAEKLLYHLGEDWRYTGTSGTGNNVYAIADGEVVYASHHLNEAPAGTAENVTLGNLVIIRHDLGAKGIFYSLYAHLASINVSVGDIDIGTKLGTIGVSGAAGGIPHLHFEIFQVNGSSTFLDYLRSGTPNPENIKWGYTDNQSAYFAGPDVKITQQEKYSEGDFVWYNPSVFLDKEMSQAVVGNQHENDSFIDSLGDGLAWTTDVIASGSNVLVSAGASVTQFLLSQFEEIRVLGGTLADRLNVRSLLGTTILNHTVYFDGGAGDDAVDGSETDRRIVAEGGSGADSFIGGSSDDVFSGGDDNDRFDGGVGADALTGGPGNDTYFVDNPGDTVIEAADEGRDVVYASANYTLTPGSSVEILSTSSQSATTPLDLTGNEFANEIYGNAGGNRLDGGGGADYLAGLGGNDIYYVDNEGVVVAEAAGEGRDVVYARAGYVLTAGSHVEVLSAISAAATTAIFLIGNELSNEIYGNAGANHLDGGGAADYMAAFAGNDVYVVDNQGDVAAEAAGEGRDVVYARSSYVLTAGTSIEVLSTIVQAATTAIDLTGNELANEIYGNAGNNRVDGGAGADYMAGLDGSDVYIVDTAGDVVAEASGQGRDVVYARVSYALAAGSYVEILSAASQAATNAIDLVGNELVNELYGNAGANYLDGGGGADYMAAFAGDDVYIVDHAGDAVAEAAGEGRDVVYARSSYALTGGSSIEVLSTALQSGTAAINLTGNELANEVYGNNGANQLNGGAGGDYLLGFGGADSFAFTTALGGGNVDMIGDFSAVDDTILLENAVFTGLAAGALSAGAFVIGAAAADADDRIIYDSATGRLFFDADGNGAGVAVQFATLATHPALTASDFVVI
jgi:Ca2+-binding RTX toxin-like protein